jgi:hypothetical protein
MFMGIYNGENGEKWEKKWGKIEEKWGKYGDFKIEKWLFHSCTTCFLDHCCIS